MLCPKKVTERLVHVSSMKIYSCWQKLCAKKKLSKPKIFTHWLICSLVIPKILPVCIVVVLNAEKPIFLPHQSWTKMKKSFWAQWQTQKEKRIVKKVEKEVNVTVEKQETGDIGTLLDRFSEGMTRFKVHFRTETLQVLERKYERE